MAVGRPRSRPRVLISAYACAPGRGSEPEVGWRWIKAAGREGIEALRDRLMLSDQLTAVALRRAIAAIAVNHPWASTTW